MCYAYPYVISEEASLQLRQELALVRADSERIKEQVHVHYTNTVAHYNTVHL